MPTGLSKIAADAVARAAADPHLVARLTKTAGIPGLGSLGKFLGRGVSAVGRTAAAHPFSVGLPGATAAVAGGTGLIGNQLNAHRDIVGRQATNIPSWFSPNTEQDVFNNAMGEHNTAQNEYVQRVGAERDPTERARLMGQRATGAFGNDYSYNPFTHFRASIGLGGPGEHSGYWNLGGLSPFAPRSGAQAAGVARGIQGDDTSRLKQINDFYNQYKDSPQMTDEIRQSYIDQINEIQARKDTAIPAYGTPGAKPSAAPQPAAGARTGYGTRSPYDYALHSQDRYPW